MTSSSQTDNDWTYSLNQTSTAYPGGPPTGTTIQSSGTFSDSTQNTTTTVAEQSGSYDSEGTNSSSSSISVTAIDQYFSESDGESHLHNGTYTLDTVSSRDSQWSTESTSLRQESFSDAGDAASWETTYEFDSSWSTHQALTEYGNTVNVDYSGSESGSNSSGSQTYTPKEEDNPSNDYEGRVTTFGGDGNTAEDEEGDDENPFKPVAPRPSTRGPGSRWSPQDLDGDGLITSADMRILRAQYLQARKELARLRAEYEAYYRYYSKLGVLTKEQQEEWDEIQAWYGWLVDEQTGFLGKAKRDITLLDSYLEWQKVRYKGQPEGIRWESCTRCHAMHGFGRGDQNPMMIDEFGFVEPEYEEGVSTFMFYSNGVLILVGTYFVAGRIIYVFQTQGAAAGTVLIVEEGVEQGIEYATGVPIIVKPTDVAESLLKKGASKSIADAAEEAAVQAAKAQERAAKKAAKATTPKTKTDALKKHILNGELDAARREAAGEVVARKKDGTPWNHVQELQDAQRGLLKRIQQLKKELGNSALDGAARRRLEAELREASRLLDISEGFLPR